MKKSGIRILSLRILAGFGIFFFAFVLIANTNTILAADISAGTNNEIMMQEKTSGDNNEQENEGEKLSQLATTSSYYVNEIGYTTFNAAIAAVNNAIGDVVLTMEVDPNVAELVISNSNITKLTIKYSVAASITIGNLKLMNMQNTELLFENVNFTTLLLENSGLGSVSYTNSEHLKAINITNNSKPSNINLGLIDNVEIIIGEVSHKLSLSIGNKVKVNVADSRIVGNLEINSTQTQNSLTVKDVSQTGNLLVDNSVLTYEQGSISFAGISDIQAAGFSIFTIVPSDSAAEFMIKSATSNTIILTDDSVSYGLTGVRELMINPSATSTRNIKMTSLKNNDLTLFTFNGSHGNSFEFTDTNEINYAAVTVISGKVIVSGNLTVSDFLVKSAQGSSFEFLADSAELSAMDGDVAVLSEFNYTAANFVKETDNKVIVSNSTITATNISFDLSVSSITEGSGNIIGNLNKIVHNISLIFDKGTVLTGNIVKITGTSTIEIQSLVSKASNIAAAINIIDAVVQINIADTTKINGTDIQIISNNLITAVSDLTSINSNKSGAYVALNIINQLTSVNTGPDTIIVQNGLSKDILIKAESSLTLKTTIEPTKDILDDSNPHLDKLFENLVSLIGNEKTELTAVKSVLSTVLDNFNASDDSSFGIQLVGAFEINVIDVTATAIMQSEKVTAAGDLKVISNAGVDVQLKGDATAIDENTYSESEAGMGAGVVIIVHVADYSNIAKIGKSEIEAKSIEVIANEDGFVNKLDMNATAGISKDTLGIGGGIGVVVFNSYVNARIENATINSSSADVTVIANENNAINLMIDCSTNEATGAAISTMIIDEKVNAEINAENMTANNINVIANGISTSSLEVRSGSAGGYSIAPGVSVHILTGNTHAWLEATALNANKITVSGNSSKTRKTNSISNLVEKGGIGAGISVIVTNDSNHARITAVNITAKEVNVSAVTQHRSDSLTTASPGNSEDSSEDAEETASVLSKILGMVDSLNSQKQKTNYSGNGQEDGKINTDMSTQEGNIGFAGAVIVYHLSLDSKAELIISGTLSADTIKVISTEAIGVYNFADASVSTTGYGFAVAVIVSTVDVDNIAYLSGLVNNVNHLEVVAKTGELTKTNELENGKDNTDKENTNDINTYANVALSGASGSKFEVAGAVVLSFVDQTSHALSDAVINTSGANPLVKINAELKERIYSRGFSETKHVAGGNDNANAEAKGSKGVAPSFVMNMIVSNVKATNKNKIVITDNGSVEIAASFTSSIDAEAEAGSASGSGKALSIDGAVVLNLITRRIYSFVESGGSVTGSGSFSLKQTTVSETNAKTSGGSLGDTAAGIAVAVTYFKADYIALMSGSVYLTGGELEIISVANNKDIIEATATAASAEEKSFKDKLGDKFDLEKIISGDQTVENTNTEAPVTQTGAEVAKFYNEGNSATRYDPKLNTSTSVLGVQNIEVDDRDPQTSQDEEGNIGASAQSQNKKKIAIAGAVAVTILNHNVIAGIAGNVKAAGITVKASNEMGFRSFNNGQTSNSDVSITLSVAVAVLGSNTEAYIKSATIESAGAVEVIANTTFNRGAFEDLIAVEAVGTAKTNKSQQGEASDKFSLAGAVAFIKHESTTNAYIDTALNIIVEGLLKINAFEDAKISAKAWNYSSASGNAVGAAFAMVNADSTITADLKANCVSVKGLDIRSERTKIETEDFLEKSGIEFTISYVTGVDFYTIVNLTNFLAFSNYYIEAIGGGKGTGKFAFQGSVGVLIYNNRTTAGISGSTIINMLNDSSDILVKSSDSKNVKAITGSLVSGGNTGFGASVIVINDNSTVNAAIGDNVIIGNLKNVRNIDVEALAETEFIVISIAGGKADNVAANGVVDVVIADNAVRASIGRNTVIKATGNLTVKAVNKANLWSIAFAGTLSDGVGIGALVSVILLNTETNAVIDEAAQIEIGGLLSVLAEAHETVKFVIGSAVAGGSAAVSLNGAYVQITSDTKAMVAKDSVITAGSAIVSAKSLTDSQSINGGIVYGKTVGINGTSTVNNYRKNVQSLVLAKSINAKQYIRVTVSSVERIVAIVANVGAGGNAAVTGTVPVSLIKNTVLAELEGIVQSTGTIEILARDTADISIYGGGVVGAGSVAVGLTANTIVIYGSTTVNIRNANINGSSLVTEAVSENTIYVFIASGGASGSVTVVGTVNTIVMNQTTSTHLISIANIDVEELKVITSNNNHITAIVGQVSLAGTVAVGASVNTITLTNKVENTMTDTKLNGGTKKTNISIFAESQDVFIVTVAGISVSGTVSVNGSMNTIITESVIQNIISGSLLNTKGSIEINADYAVLLDTKTGAIAASSTVAAGTAVEVFVNNSNTANIINDNVILIAHGETTLDSVEGIQISARTNTVITTILVSGAAAIVSVSPTVGTYIISGKTNNLIGSKVSIASDRFVAIRSYGNLDFNAAIGAEAIGLTGVGASVLVLNSTKTVSTVVGQSSSIHGKSGVAIHTDSLNDIKGHVIGFAGGLVSAVGTASVVTVEETIATSFGADSAIASDIGSVTIASGSEQKYTINTWVFASGAVSVNAANVTLIFKSTVETYSANITAYNNINILTTAKENIASSIIGGTASGIGIGGSVIVLVLNNEITSATIPDARIVSNNGIFAIAAKDDLAVASQIASLNIAGISVGAGVSVILIQNTIAAYIGKDNSVVAKTIIVEAELNRTITSKSDSVNARVISANGMIAVIKVGIASNDNIDEKIVSEIGVIEANNNEVTSYRLTTDINAPQGMVNAFTKAKEYQDNISVSVDSYFTANAVNNQDKTSAYIDDGAQLSAAGISIIAKEINDFDISTQSANASVIPVGAGVIVFKHYGNVQAYSGNDVIISGFDKLLIKADSSNQTYQLKSITQNAGLVLTLGATVVVIEIGGNTIASINENTVVDNGSSVDVVSFAKYNVITESTVKSGSLSLAAGSSVLIINLKANVKSLIGTNAQIKGIADLSVSSQLHMILQSELMPSSKALGAVVSGTVLAINLAGKVLSSIIDHSVISASNTITVRATAITDISSTIAAVNIGALSGNGTSATIANEISVGSEVRGSGKTAANQLNINAYYNTDETLNYLGKMNLVLNALSGAIANASGLVVTYSDNANVFAALGSRVIADSIAVNAKSVAYPQITASSGGAGGASLSGHVINITTDQTISAATLDNTIINTRTLAINALLLEQTRLVIHGFELAGISIGGISVNLNMKSNIAAAIADNNMVDSEGNIMVKAVYNEIDNTPVDAFSIIAYNASGALLNGSRININSTISTTVNSAIGAGSKINTLIAVSGDVDVIAVAHLRGIINYTAISTSGIGFSDFTITLNIYGNVTSQIGDNSVVNGNTISVRNDVYSYGYVETYGANFGGLSIGSTTVTLNIEPSVNQIIGTSAHLVAAKDIRLVSYYNMKKVTPSNQYPVNYADGTYAVISDSSLGGFINTGASSGALVGVNASVVSVNHKTKINVIIKANGMMVAGNSIFTYSYLSANSIPKVKSDSSGLVVAGGSQIINNTSVSNVISVADGVDISNSKKLIISTITFINQTASVSQHSGGLIGVVENTAGNTAENVNLISIGNVTFSLSDELQISANTVIETKSNTVASGSSGVNIGGFNLPTIITSSTKVSVADKAALSSEYTVNINAASIIDIASNTIAISGTNFLGDGKSSDINITVTMDDGINIGKSVKITANDLFITSNPQIIINGTSESRSGSVVPKTELRINVILNQVNEIYIGESTELSAIDKLQLLVAMSLDVFIKAESEITGLISSSLFDAVFNAPKVNNNITIGNNVLMNSKKINILSDSDIAVDANAILIKDISAMSLSNKANAKIDIKSNNIITFGSNSSLYATDTINIQSKLSHLKLSAYASTHSIKLNTSDYLVSEIKVSSTVAIQATNSIFAANSYVYIQSVIENVSMSASTTGRIEGVTGTLSGTSIIDADISALVRILGEDSSITATNIIITATSPVNDSKTTYAWNRADVETIVEVVLVAIEKTMEVVEEITEKITKWLPWPFSSIIRWFVKTVVKVVKYIVNEWVRVVLNSGVTDINKVTYKQNNMIELYGTLSYGTSIPLAIVIAENGDVSSNVALDYITDENNVWLNTIGSKETGALYITSYNGTIKGKVTIVRNAGVSSINITNNSSKTVHIGTVSFYSDSDDPEMMVLSNNDTEFEMDFLVYSSETTDFSVTSNNNGNVNFFGYIKILNGILKIESNAGITTDTSSILTMLSMEITAKYIGSADNGFSIELANGFHEVSGLVVPSLKVNAAEDVFIDLDVSLYTSTEEQFEAETMRNLQVSVLALIARNLNLNIISSMLIFPYIQDIVTVEFVPVIEKRLIYELQTDGRYAEVYRDVVIGYESTTAITPGSILSKTLNLVLIIDEVSDVTETLSIKSVAGKFHFNENGQLNAGAISLDGFSVISSDKTSSSFVQSDVKARNLNINIAGYVGSVNHYFYTNVDTLTLHGSSHTEIYIKDLSENINVTLSGALAVIRSAGSIAFENTYLHWLDVEALWNITGVTEADMLTAKASNIDIENSNDLLIIAITADNNLILDVKGNITASPVDTLIKVSGLFRLRAAGSVGTLDNPLIINVSGYFVSETKGSLFVGTDYKLIIGRIESALGDVVISALHDILVNNSDAVIRANNIVIETLGTRIGANDGLLNIALAENGQLKLRAQGSIWLNAVTDITIDVIEAAEKLFLLSNANIYAVNSKINISGTNISIVIAATGETIGTKDRYLSINTAKSVDIQALEGSLYLAHEGVLNLERITSKSIVDLAAESIYGSGTGSVIMTESAYLKADKNIGITESYLVISVAKLNIKADDIFISNNGSLELIGDSKAENLVTLEVKGDLTGAPEHLLEARRLEIRAAGDVGTADQYLSSKAEELLVIAKDSIYLVNDETTNVTADEIHSNKLVDLITGDIIISNIETERLLLVSNTTEIKGTISQLRLTSTALVIVENSQDILLDEIKVNDVFKLTVIGNVNTKLATQVEAKRLEIRAAGDVGSAGHYLSSKTEELTVTAKDSIYLENDEMINVTADTIHSNKLVDLITGDISIKNIETERLLLVSKTTEIKGTITQLRLTSTASVIVENSQDILLDEIKVNDVFKLTVTGNVNTKLAMQVETKRLEIRAAGDVGTADQYLSSKAEELLVIAKDSIYLVNDEMINVTVDEIRSNKLVDLITGDIIISNIETERLLLVSKAAEIKGTITQLRLTSTASVIVENSQDILLDEIKVNDVFKLTVTGNVNTKLATQVEARRLEIRAAGDVGTADQYLSSKAEELLVIAKDVIYLSNNQETDVTADTIHSNKLVDLITGDISIKNIETERLLLVSKAAEIKGTISQLRLTSTASAIIENSQDILLDEIKVNDVFKLTVTGNVNTKLATQVEAQRLEIRAAGDVGSAGHYLSSKAEELLVIAKDSIYLVNDEMINVTVDEIRSNKLVDLITGDIIISNIETERLLLVSKAAEIKGTITQLRLTSTASVIVENSQDILLDEIKVNDVFKLTVTGNVNTKLATQVEARRLEIRAAGDVGTADQYLSSMAEELLVTAKDTMYLVNDSSINLLVEMMSSSQLIDLIAGEINIRSIVTDQLKLRSFASAVVAGSVNQLETDIAARLEMSNSRNLQLLSVKAGTNIKLTVSGDITGIKDTLALEGNNISIVSSGSIGNADMLLVKTGNNGRLEADAGSNIYLESSEAIVTTHISGGATVHLISNQGIDTADGGSITADTLRIDARSAGSISNPLLIYSNELSGSIAGKVYIRSSDSLYIAGLSGNIINLIGTVFTGYGVVSDELIIRGTRIDLSTHTSVLDAVANILIVSNNGNLMINTIQSQSLVLINNGDVATGGRITASKISLTIRGAANLETTADIISGSVRNDLNLLNSKGIAIVSGSSLQVGQTLMMNVQGDVTVEKGAELSAYAMQINGNSNGSLLLRGTINADILNINSSVYNELVFSGTVKEVNIYSSTANDTWYVIKVYNAMDYFNFTGNRGSNQISLDVSELGSKKTTQWNIDGSGNDDSLTIVAKPSGSSFDIRNISLINLTGSHEDETYVFTSKGLTQSSGLEDDYTLDGVNVFELNAVGGNNLFIFTDTFSQTFISGGNGNNRYFIGEIISSSQDAVRTTEGYLSKGISHNTTINDGNANSEYRIYSSLAPLIIHTGAGQDTITMKLFLVKDSNGKYYIYQNDDVELYGTDGDNVIIIKARPFDSVMISANMIDAEGNVIIMNGLSTVDVQSFSAADGAIDSLSSGEMFMLGVNQLYENGTLTIIIAVALLLISMLSVLWIKRRRKKRMVI